MKSETITFYKGRKEALATSRVGHLEKEYDILSDTIEEDVRVLRIKPKDLSEINKLREELTEVIAEKLGEGTSKTFKAILSDTLTEYDKASIKRMYKKLIEAKGEVPPVKATKGCFEIIIGDGRRKKSEIIRIRE